MMRRIRCLGVVLLLMGLLLASAAGLSVVFMPKDNRAECGMVEPVANGFLGEREHSIDVLFVGDSEVYRAYSPLQMWHEQGFTSYVAATAGQILPYGNTLLSRALENQSPQVVVIETDFLYREFSLGDGVFRFAQDVFPVLEYHNRWKALTVADFHTRPRATWTDDYKGYQPIKDVKAADVSDYGAASDEVARVPRNNQLWLRLMVRSCRAHGATPVLMSTPSPVNWNMAKHNGTQLVADELGVTFVDLNLAREEIAIDWSNETYDAGDHLNHAGAVKVSRYVGQLLSREYCLVDRRSDPAYALWNASYERYREAGL